MARSNIPVTKIASDAGVSPATVSRVLKHPELVQGKTRIRIEDAIKNAGYDIDALLKQNNENTNNVIMVVLPTIENPFYNNILKGIKTSGVKCVIVAVYGNRAYEDALVEMQDVATERRMNFSYNKNIKQ